MSFTIHHNFPNNRSCSHSFACQNIHSRLSCWNICIMYKWIRFCCSKIIKLYCVAFFLSECLRALDKLFVDVVYRLPFLDVVPKEIHWNVTKPNIHIVPNIRSEKNPISFYNDDVTRATCNVSWNRFHTKIVSHRQKLHFIVNAVRMYVCIKTFIWSSSFLLFLFLLKSMLSLLDTTKVT